MTNEEMIKKAIQFGYELGCSTSAIVNSKADEFIASLGPQPSQLNPLMTVGEMAGTSGSNPIHGYSVGMNGSVSTTTEAKKASKVSKPWLRGALCEAIKRTLGEASADLTVGEIASRIGGKIPSVYQALRGLEKNGEVAKDGKLWWLVAPNGDAHTLPADWGQDAEPTRKPSSSAMSWGG